MALLDMISKITDKVTVLTIDTGFIFKETAEFREEVMRRYKLPVEVLRPDAHDRGAGRALRRADAHLHPEPVLPGPQDRAPAEGPEPLRRLDDRHPPGADPPEGGHEGRRLGGALRGRQDSADARTGRRSRCGTTSGRTTCPSTRSCTRATRASAASRRRGPCTTTRTPGPAGGPGLDKNECGIHFEGGQGQPRGRLKVQTILSLKREVLTT